MTEKPILFSAPMVLALLAGRKTQTRRLIALGDGAKPETSSVAYGMGDTLYVREAISMHRASGLPYVRYDADRKATFHPWPETWKRFAAPAMHMPKAFSRIRLKVTEVRVQRLQEITRADCLAEGAPVDLNYHDVSADKSSPPMVRVSAGHYMTVRGWYHQLWDSLNAKRAPWDSNPWVAAYTFEVKK